MRTKTPLQNWRITKLRNYSKMATANFKNEVYNILTTKKASYKTKGKHESYVKKSSQGKIWYNIETDQEISCMDGAHFHRLTHLNFKLLYNVLFCPTNFLFCSSIGNRTDFYLEIQDLRKFTHQIINSKWD